MSQPDPVLTMAAETQQKFQFYLLTLTFGVLALSIQTVASAAPLTAQCAELIGWIGLLTSGAIGLWRLELTPQAYKLMGLQDQASGRAHDLAVSKASGHKIVHVTADQQNWNAGASVFYVA